jgi:hypothetical protein
MGDARIKLRGDILLKNTAFIIIEIYKIRPIFLKHRYFLADFRYSLKTLCTPAPKDI